MDNSHSEQEGKKLKLSDLKKIHKTSTDLALEIANDQPKTHEQEGEGNSPKPFTERKKLIRKIWNTLIPLEKKHKEELSEAVSNGEIDNLTQIFNERGFTRRWTEEVSRLRRVKQDGKEDSSVLLYLDANKLKQVNDQNGHEAGNEYLKKIALGLRESVRPTDIVARIGGDEFAVILQNADLSQTRELIETRIYPRLTADEVSVSIGSALIDPENPTESKEHADSAMYTAKHISRAKYGTIEYVEYGEIIK